MVVDPSDMLIFKMRGMQFGAATQKKPSPAQPTPARPQAMPQQKQPEEEAPVTGRAFAARTMSDKEGVMEEREQEERDSSSTIAKFYEERGRSMQGFITGQENAAAEPAHKRNKTRSGKEEIDAAKGLTCINHPWRPAYAVCDYCERAFCYADLISHDGKFYCLEDIDNVSKSESKKLKQPVNAFSTWAGAVFILNALLITYFVFPQLGYLAQYISQNGFLALLNGTGNYISIFLDVLLVWFSFASGALLLLRSSSAYLAGTFTGATTLLLVSFEWLNTSVTFLLVITLISFVSIVVLAFSRMSSATVEKTVIENAQQTGEINWPRIETF